MIKVNPEYAQYRPYFKISRYFAYIFYPSRIKADIHYIRQKEAKGLGHAIYCAKTFVGNEPFAVMLGDDVVYNEDTPCLKQMIDVYDEYKISVLGVQTVKDEDVCKYGIVDGERVSDRVYTVKGLVEKPAVDEAPSNVAILGRYIINPGIFDILAETKPGKGGEICYCQ